MAAPANATLKLEPFIIDIPDKTVDEFKTLLKLSKLPPATYAGTQRELGITSAWMSKAKEEWENNFSWSDFQSRLNNVPGAAHYRTTVTVKDTYNLHFLAHFSGNPSAQPLVFLHGWPGDFTEYLPTLDYILKNYPNDYDVIIPSLPGYTFSSGPPADHDISALQIADVLHTLILGLGYKSYVAVGGDLGSFLAQLMSAKPECRGIHLNMWTPSEQIPTASTCEIEKAAAARRTAFLTTGRAYFLEHVTRPSTISHALHASPLALLAWIAEKFLDWTDEDPSIQTVLEHVTLWYLTETQARGVYLYRLLFAGGAPDFKGPTVEMKPHGKWGYSWFPKEITPATREELDGQRGKGLLYVGWHERGGHFAGFEMPEAYVEDARKFLGELDKVEGK